MYVTLLLIFVALFSVGTILAQQVFKTSDNSHDQLRNKLRHENRLRKRQEMHQRMLEKLLHGNGPDQDMFKDMEEFMDEAMRDTFSTSHFAQIQNYKTEWKETSTGRILEITPKSPSQQLDINVSNGFVVIKENIETKTANGSSISSSSNSFNVPEDCDPGKVKMETREGKIVMEFPYAVAKKLELKKVPDNRKPLAPTEQDIQI